MKQRERQFFKNEHDNETLGASIYYSSEPMSQSTNLTMVAKLSHFCIRRDGIVFFPLYPVLQFPGHRLIDFLGSTHEQALAQTAKFAHDRDANPGAVRGPKPAGMTPSTLLQTHLGILVVRYEHIVRNIHRSIVECCRDGGAIAS